MKRTVTRALSFAMVLIMLLAMAACENQEATANPQENTQNPNIQQGAVPEGNKQSGITGDSISADAEKGTSTICLQYQSDPGIDPYAGGDFQIGFLVCENLFTYNYDGEIVPCCMESYELAEDGMSMTVHIPENLVTHNGYKVTAEDYIWCAQKEIEGNGSRFVKIIDVPNSYVVDEHTVVYAFKEKWTDFNYANLTHLNITSQEAYESDPEGVYNTVVCGTGPYKITSHLEGSEFVLEKNENYWGGHDYWGAQNIDRIVVKVISESAQKTIEFEAGYVDMLTSPGNNDIDYLKTLPDADVYQEALNKNIAICFNVVNGGPLTDKRVRQAIGYAIDNNAICEQAFGGQKIAATGVINPVDREWDDSMYTKTGYYDYNIEKAKELLAEAGYANGFSISLCYSDNQGQTFQLMSQIIQSQLNEIGITMSITPYDDATFSTLFGGVEGWDMCLTPYKIEDTAFFHFYNVCNKNTIQRGGWYNEEFQTLLDATVYNMDDTESIQKMIDIYEDEQPFYTIAYDTNYFVVRKGVENVAFKGDNWYFPNDWSYGAGCDNWLYD